MISDTHTQASVPVPDWACRLSASCLAIPRPARPNDMLTSIPTRFKKPQMKLAIRLRGKWATNFMDNPLDANI
jgi:hypothetical protein